MKTKWNIPSTNSRRQNVVPFETLQMEDITASFQKRPPEGSYRIWSLNSPTIDMGDSHWMKPPFGVEINEDKNHVMSVSLEESVHEVFFKNLESRLIDIVYENRELLLPKRNPDQTTRDSIRHFSAFEMIVKSSQDPTKGYKPTVSFKIDRRNHRLLRFKHTTDAGRPVYTTKGISLQEITWRSRVSFRFSPQYLCVYGNGKIACGLVVKTLLIKQPGKRAVDFLTGTQVRNPTNQLFSEINPTLISIDREVKGYKSGQGKFCAIKDFPRFQLPPCQAPFGYSKPLDYKNSEPLTSVSVTINITDAKIQEFFRSVDTHMLEQIAAYSADKDWFRRSMTAMEVDANYYKNVVQESKLQYAPKLKFRVYLPKTKDDQRYTRIWRYASDGTLQETTYEHISRFSWIVPILSVTTFWKGPNEGSLTLKATDVLVVEEGGGGIVSKSFDNFDIVDSSSSEEDGMDPQKKGSEENFLNYFKNTV